jgi:hypothetical protein
MVQILSGLITYLLLAIYCHTHHGEKVSIKRVRELRIQIQNETRTLGPRANPPASNHHFKEQGLAFNNAKT